MIDVGGAGHSLSPEQFLTFLTAVQKTAGVSLDPPSGWATVATVINSLTPLAWPLTIGLVAWAYRPQLRQMFDRVIEVEGPGFKAKIGEKIEREVAASGQQARVDDRGPTPDELERAQQVGDLAAQTDTATILAQVSKLAAEYERIRASLPSGRERTVQMNGVASKMRAIGIAASPLRYELSASPSPGKRLQAIESLQVQTDIDMVQWLLERVMTETPFLSYHALIAIHLAARTPNARTTPWIFEAVLKALDTPPKGFDKDPPRVEMLKLLRDQISGLSQPRRN